MKKEHIEVMVNILYAVETGGQVYGGRRYDDFTEAYHNSSMNTQLPLAQEPGMPQKRKDF